MIDCMILGDSIAVGVHQQRPECVSYSKVGINSWNWNKNYLPVASNKPAKTVIISLGANDHAGVKTEEELRKMRLAVKADRVFWISPGAERKPMPHAAIERIAQEYNDTVLSRPQDHMSPDGVHPTARGYQQLAQKTR